MKKWLIPSNKTGVARKEMHLYHVCKILNQTDYVSLDKALEKNYRCVPVPSQTNSKLCYSSGNRSPRILWLLRRWVERGTASRASCGEIVIIQRGKSSVFPAWVFNPGLKSLLPCKVQVETVALLCICQALPLITESGMINMRRALMWVSAWTPPVLR